MSKVCSECGAETKGYSNRCHSCGLRVSWNDKRRAEASERQRIVSNTPGHKAQARESIIKWNRSEEGRAASTARLSTPEAREKSAALITKWNKSEEARENTKRLNKSSERRQKSSARMKMWMQVPEHKAEATERLMRWSQSEEGRDSSRRNISAYIQKPESRRKAAEDLARWLATPEARQVARENAIKVRQTGLKRTKIERRVSEILADLDVPFESEKRFKGIGLVDFYVESAALAIECDGNYWHNLFGRKERDAERDRKLNEIGIRVLRLPENDINKHPELCVEMIVSKLAVTDPTEMVRRIRQLPELPIVIHA